jgi:hypothetical protein
MKPEDDGQGAEGSFLFVAHLARQAEPFTGCFRNAFAYRP